MSNNFSILKLGYIAKWCEAAGSGGRNIRSVFTLPTILRDQRASWKHTLFLPKLLQGQRATSECWVYRWALLCQAEIFGFISYAHNTGRLCHMKEYI